ncbi:MAG: AAA family ATPase [Acidobacteriia bacterium]|nr:AAA family ATPase [Terriglobia bacterium]
MLIKIPERSLVLLIGAAGSGKSTFARKHFKTTEIVSSDALRGVVSDDESDQTASADAFQLLRMITGMRLRRGRLTVIDATNVQRPARKALLALAAQNSAPATAIVFNLPAAVCLARNQSRLTRPASAEVVEKQVADMLSSLPGLDEEGFQYAYVMDNTGDIDSAQVLRETWNM